MRKIFLLSSILLLFIGVALANAPPVLDIGDSPIELTIYLPGDHMDLTGVVMDAIQFTAVEQAFNLPTQAERINIENPTIPEVIDIGYAYALNGEVSNSDTQGRIQKRTNYTVVQDSFVERGCL